MLFSAVASIALLSATALGSTVQLSIESDNQDVNNNGLSSIHEGAGINYFLLGNSSQTIDYNESTGILSFASSPEVVQSFGVTSNIVQLSVASSPSPVKFTDNLLSFNGSTSNFYACKNINDPYNYSKNSYALTYYTSDAPDGCIAVKVKVAEGAASSSSAASSATSSAQASSAPEVTSATSSAPASSAPEVSAAPNGAGANAAAGSLVGGAALLFGLLA